MMRGPLAKFQVVDSKAPRFRPGISKAATATDRAMTNALHALAPAPSDRKMAAIMDAFAPLAPPRKFQSPEVEAIMHECRRISRRSHLLEIRIEKLLKGLRPNG